VPAILLVKTSSLGDVVHNLPVATDIRRALPAARIDWLVEESFTAIPGLHPALSRVIACAPRRWRRTLLRPDTWQEIRELRAVLHEIAYDFVIDTQGLLKSALVSRLAPGARHGLDWRSSREPLRWLYDAVHAVPWGIHAVERNRALAAQALGFTVSGQADYGIAPPKFPPSADEDDSPADVDRPWLEPAERYAWVPSGPFAVFLHGTSAERKLWPEHQWKKLAAHYAGAGIACVLLWGGPAEHARSDRIADGLRDVIVPPRMGLHALAGLLGRAQFVVGVDTGLAHLAAALRRPTVGIYVATDPQATGVYAPEVAVNVGSASGAPSLAAVLDAVGKVTA
jgi:heptosyltransferase-1